MTDKTEYNKRYYEKEKPYPLRLGELKRKVQIEAFEKDKSMHAVLKDIVREHFDSKEMSLREIMKPLSNL
jgi:hypothetical protein